MEIKIFTVSVHHGESMNEELNKFLRSHKVVDIEKRFVSQDHGAYWSFCVSYITGGKVSVSNTDRRMKKDYREILDAKTFSIFEKLRSYRREIAKNDAVPAFAVFTDAELVKMAKEKEITLAKIKTIKGIGEKKLEKYGHLLLKMYQDEANRQSD